MTHRPVCRCVCVCVRLTDVVQRWIKHGELFVKDVILHFEGLAVGAAHVEPLLAEHHANL